MTMAMPMGMMTTTRDVSLIIKHKPSRDKPSAKPCLFRPMDALFDAVLCATKHAPFLFGRTTGLNLFSIEWSSLFLSSAENQSPSRAGNINKSPYQIQDQESALLLFFLLWFHQSSLCVLALGLCSCCGCFCFLFVFCLLIPPPSISSTLPTAPIPPLRIVHSFI